MKHTAYENTDSARSAPDSIPPTLLPAFRVACAVDSPPPRRRLFPRGCADYRGLALTLVVIVSLLLPHQAQAWFPAKRPSFPLIVVPEAFLAEPIVTNPKKEADQNEDSQRPDPNLIAQCVVAVVVVAVGVYISYKIYKFCKQKFPPPPPPAPTNAPPTTNAANFAAIVYMTNYVGQPGEATAELTFGADGTIQATPVTESVSRVDFFNSLTNYGLPNFNSTPLTAGRAFYGANGQPATNSPISVTVATNGIYTLRMGASTNRVLVWRSLDLTNWQVVSTNFIPAGYKLQFTPTTTNAQEFYRLSD